MLTLAIIGFEAEPQVASNAIGVEPISTAINGQLGKSGGPNKLNGWWLDAYPDRLSDGASHVQAVSSIVDLLWGSS